jgi:hypothetical protein
MVMRKASKMVDRMVTMARVKISATPRRERLPLGREITEVVEFIFTLIVFTVYIQNETNESF